MRRTALRRGSSRRAIAAIGVAALLCVAHAAEAARLGDVNLDGAVDIADAVVLQSVIARGVALSAEQQQAADVAPWGASAVTPDGVLDVRDLTVLLRVVAGEIGLVPPAPNVAAVPTPTAVNPVLLTGTAGAGYTVTVYANGVAQGTTTANASGSFSFLVILDDSTALAATASDGFATSPLSAAQTVTYSGVVTRSYPTNATLSTACAQASGCHAGKTYYVWTPGNPVVPFTIGGTLNVPNSVVLVLRPGTRVEFASGTGTQLIQVQAGGELRIQGSPTAKVELAGPNISSKSGYVNVTGNGASATITHARFENAEQGVLAGTNTSLVVRDSEILNFGTTNSHRGIYFNGASGEAIGNTITRPAATNKAGNGIDILNCAPRIESNTIRHTNFGIAISSSGTSTPAPQIIGNLVESNATGISVGSYTRPVIQTNQVRSNTTVGIEIEGIYNNGAATPAPAIQGNEFANIQNLRVDLFANASTSVVSVDDNAWGSDDPVAIANTISDRSDLSTGHRPWVDFTPFRNSQGELVDGNYLYGPILAPSVTIAAGTYQTLGDLYVPPGRALTVPAGVTIRFLPGTGLYVDGTLVAQGTAASRAVFTTTTTSPTNGDWEGIYIQAGSTGTAIDRAEISFAHHGVDVRDATASITNSRILNFGRQISFNPGTGIYLERSNSTISWNEISTQLNHGSFTVYGMRVDESSPSIVENTISGADDGIRVSGSATRASAPTIAGNTISLNTNGSGVYFESYTAGTVHLGNVIAGNRYGIQLDGTLTGTKPNPLLLGNFIHGNSLYNLYAHDFGTSPGVFDASLNYWGSTDPIAIGAMVGDQTTLVSSEQGPYVLYAPFHDASGTAVAGSYLGGRISENTSLAAGSTYAVTGDLRVDPGVTLTVEPGVVLRFVPSARLAVDGTLVVAGEAGNRAVFTSLKPVPASGDWEGIYLSASSAGSMISQAEVRYAERGVDVKGTSTSIVNSLIADAGIAGTTCYAIHLEDAGGTIDGNEIRHDLPHTGQATHGIRAFKSSPTISNNWIHGVDTGIFIVGTAGAIAAPVLTGNTIESNTTHGLYIEEYTAPTVTSGNTIQLNDYGFYVAGNSAAGANPSPVVNGNTIRDNSVYNFLVSGFAAGAQTLTVNASANYWGTTDAATIGAKIYDQSDTTATTVPFVGFTPYLDAQGNLIGATTYLNGPLASSTTLSTGTTYDIVGDVTVPTGLTLTVQAGATLRFAPSAGLLVSGGLVVQGSSSSPAVFISNKAVPARGDWDGIVLEAGSATATIAYAEIRHAVRGVDIKRTIASVTNSLITDYSGAGVYVDSAATDVVIQGNTISHDLTGPTTGNGVHVKRGAPDLVANTIRKAASGIYVEGTAAEWGTPDIKTNTIEECTSGVYLRSFTAPVITDVNVLTLNGYGMRLQGGGAASSNPNPIVSGNRIYGNTLYNLLGQSFGNPGDTLLNVENNYWGYSGASDASAIAATLYDRADDNGTGSAPVIDFVPFHGTNGVPVAANQLLVGFVMGGTTTLSGTTPYQVVGYLDVRPGATLNVGSGVTLQFIPSASLENHGTLTITGASGAGNEVLLTTQKAPPARGDWRGVRVHPGSSTTIDFATIEWANRGLEATSVDVTVRDSSFREFSDAGIYMQKATGGATPGGELARLLIDNGNKQESGIYLSGAAPHISGSTIRNTRYGIYAIAGSNPLIDGENTITANTYGIALQGNGQAAGNPSATIRRNNLSGNVTANLFLSQIYNVDGTYLVDARENYWGSTTPGQITPTISASTSVPTGSGQANVDFSDFLDAAGGTPIVATYQTQVIGLVSHARDVFEPAFESPVGVQFTIAVPVSVTLELCPEADDVCATPVRSLTQNFASAGVKTMSWDGRDNAGQYVPDEAYSYRLVATDGVPDGANEGTYFPARGFPGITFDKGTPTATFNAFRNEYWKTTVNLSGPRRLSLMIGTAFVWEDRPYPAGNSLVVWDGRDVNGAIRSGQTGVYFFLKNPLKPNAILVRRTAPAIVGVGTAPQIEVKADPYFVSHSYEQIARMTYRLDQNANVAVKLLPPGVSNPTDPRAIVVHPSQPRTAFGGGGAPIDHVVEWSGHDGVDTNEIRASESGAFSFVIEATSAETGQGSTYRGVLQARP